MTTDEKISRLEAYPFYAASAVEDYLMSTPLTPEQRDAEVEAIVAGMAKRLGEKELNFIKYLIRYSEKCQEARLAGVLKGMTPKARKQWIEEKAT